MDNSEGSWAAALKTLLKRTACRVLAPTERRWRGVPLLTGAKGGSQTAAQRVLHPWLGIVRWVSPWLCEKWPAAGHLQYEGHQLQHCSHETLCPLPLPFCSHHASPNPGGAEAAKWAKEEEGKSQGKKDREQSTNPSLYYHSVLRARGRFEWDEMWRFWVDWTQSLKRRLLVNTWKWLERAEKADSAEFAQRQRWEKKAASLLRALQWAKWINAESEWTGAIKMTLEPNLSRNEKRVPWVMERWSIHLMVSDGIK